MPELTKAECFDRLIEIYFRSVDAGWDKMASVLALGEKGGVWLRNSTYVYYPGQEPLPCSLSEFDDDDEMLEMGAHNLFVEIWERDAQAGNKWHNATYFLYPDRRFEFKPTSDPEKTYEEAFSRPPAP